MLGLGPRSAGSTAPAAARARQLRARARHHRRVRRAAAAPRARRCGCWPPAASRWGCRSETRVPGADAAGRRRRAPIAEAVGPRRPWRCSCERARRGQPDLVADAATVAGRGRALPAPRRRAAGDRAGRGPVPRPVAGRDHRTPRRPLRPARRRAAGSPTSGTARCARSSTGPTTCSTRPSRSCSDACRRSPAPFDLDAAERVCGYGDLRAAPWPPCSPSLVDKSMVQASAGDPHHATGCSRPCASTAPRSPGGGGRARPPARRLVGRGVRARRGRRARRRRAARGSTRSSGVFDDLRLAVRNALETRRRRHRDAHRRRRPRVRLPPPALRAHRLGGGGARRRPTPTTNRWPPPTLGIVAYGRFVRGESRRRHRAGRAFARRSPPRTAPTRSGWPIGRSATPASSTATGRAPSPPWLRLRRRSAGLGRRRPHGPRLLHALAWRDADGGTDAGMRYAEQALRRGRAQPQPDGDGAGGLRPRHLVRPRRDPGRARELLSTARQLARDVGNRWFELFARTETLWLRALDGEPLEALPDYAEVLVGVAPRRRLGEPVALPPPRVRHLRPGRRRRAAP